MLNDMRDSQVETTLLRSCLALPKLSYVLRTCPPDHITHATRQFDSIMREALESIVSSPITDWSWQKASLPSNRGGRSAVLHAPAAFISSAASTKTLVERILNRPTNLDAYLEKAVSALPSSSSHPEWLNLDDIDIPLCQRHLSCAIDEAMYQNLLDTSPSTRACALANSSALPHAGDWLNGVPSDVLGLHMQDKEFNSCLKYWLGIPLHSAPHLCPACRTTADEYGDHQVGCGGNGDRITRHNAVRDVIFSAAQSAALGPSREAQGLIPESLSRPADVFLPTWQGGRPAALDVHVISPLQQTLIYEAAFSPGHALEVGVRRTLTTHLQACRSIGVNFIPIVAETLGGLGEEAINIIGAIGNAIDRRVTMTHSTSSTKKHLFHRLAIALWRENACLWLHR